MVIHIKRHHYLDIIIIYLFKINIILNIINIFIYPETGVWIGVGITTGTGYLLYLSVVVKGKLIENGP